MFSKGKTNVQVAIKLDIPQIEVTQFRLEYQKLQGLDNLESLYVMTKGKVSPLWKLYQELVIKRGMSFKAVANIVDIAIHKLPYMETLYEQAKRAADRQQDKVDYLENRIRSLDEEEKRRKRTITLSPCNYYVNDRENPAMKAFSSNIRQPSQLPYWPTEDYDPWSEYRNKHKTRREEEVNSRDMKEI